MQNTASSLIECLQQMSAANLSEGSSGNASIRMDDGMLITPTGFASADITVADLVQVSESGETLGSRWQASSEWHFHLAIYQQFPDAHAIVHSHSRAATALACTGSEIPSFHYMVATAGGNNIRCANYALFGTEALAANIVTAMADRKACLIANHGQIAIGGTPKDALQLAKYVEDLAATYLLCKDKTQLLTNEQMAEVLERFAGYGRSKLKE